MTREEPDGRMVFRVTLEPEEKSRMIRSGAGVRDMAETLLFLMQKAMPMYWTMMELEEMAR